MHRLVKDLVARHLPGVLLVTHDVDEAIMLADRILVMRDGAIAAEHFSHKFAARTLRETLLGELGVETGCDAPIQTTI